MFDFLGDILGGIGSIFSGGLLGLIGGIFTKFQELAILKEKNRHEETMQEKEKEFLAMELSRDVQVARHDENARVAASESAAMQASYQHDSRRYLDDKAMRKSVFAIYLMAIVDFFRGILRPGLTVYLTVLAQLTFNHILALYHIAEQAGFTLTPEQAFQLLYLCVVFILFLASTAVGWWFAVRPSQLAKTVFEGRELK